MEFRETFPSMRMRPSVNHSHGKEQNYARAVGGITPTAMVKKWPSAGSATVVEMKPFFKDSFRVGLAMYMYID